MNCKFRPGSLVIYEFTRHPDSMSGIVLDVKPSYGVFRDSAGLDEVYYLEVLWDRDVPAWLGEGRIMTVADSVVRHFEEFQVETG
ncbi:MAG: hypothetical protein FJY85_00760 [Deltaproteobacteria bacterium]|nr:hypothetical protein [Deltaproteobacteria bacterium]